MLETHCFSSHRAPPRAHGRQRCSWFLKKFTLLLLGAYGSPTNWRAGGLSWQGTGASKEGTKLFTFNTTVNVNPLLRVYCSSLLIIKTH